MRVFLDANVLFSAAKSDGAVRELLRRLVVAGHVPCADAYVVEEARRNLLRKGAGAVATLEELLSSVAVAPYRRYELPAAAASVACEVLVTGDRTHFGAMYGEVLLGVRIESPRSLAERLSL